MKNFVFVIICLVVCLHVVHAQQEITIKKNGDTMTASATIDGTPKDLKDLDSKTNIALKPDPVLTEIKYKLFKVGAAGEIQIPDSQFSGTSIVGLGEQTELKLVVTAKDMKELTFKFCSAAPGGNTGNSSGSSGSSGSGTGSAGATNSGSSGSGSGTGTISAESYLATASFPPQWSEFSGLVNSGRRYKPTRNKAFIVLDERGKLIGNLPVNLDQDDYIYILVATPVRTEDDYDLEVVGGEYAPVDLQIRSYDAPASISTQSKRKPADWSFVAWERGPYTSDQVTFNVKRKDLTTGNYTTIGSYTVRINKLYHVGIGASFVSTRLASPTYDVGTNGTGAQTIMITDDGTRTFATFNVIWYWSNTLRYIARGSVLTRGRDVLKEPSFLERINPTFGVALNNTWQENFFVGGVFEFARGGNLTAGYHYGKFQTLADKSFVLGETAFTGTKDDIKLEDKWDWGFYFGITLDTRIFNKLVARQ